MEPITAESKQLNYNSPFSEHLENEKQLNKPKRLKPRRAVRSLSFRLGRFQVEVTIWKWRKV